jgi:PmbA protein
MVTKNMNYRDAAAYALEKLLKAGADKAVCSASSGRKDEFNIEADDFSLLRTVFSNGISLKAIKEHRKGVTVINKLEKDAIDRAVELCVEMAASAEPDEAEDIADIPVKEKFDRRIGGSDMAGLFSSTKQFLEEVAEQFPKIILEGVTTDFCSGESIFLNSNGVEFLDYSEYYSMGTMFSAKDGEKGSSFSGYSNTYKTLDIPIIDMGLHRSQLQDSVRSLDTRMVDGKFDGKIIVTPVCDDMIWDTVFGTFLSDMSLITETSRWKDSLGEKVADCKLTMRLNPFRDDLVAGERYTGDGFLSEATDIIRDGVLKSFALSLYGSNKTGKPRAKASSGLEVAPGNVPLEEMIKSIDRGILINRFSGASPGPSGDVSGIAKNSFLIENGKVTDALAETMLSFNIIDILQEISAISVERCAIGSSLLPWCCFDGVTISGK